VDTRLMLRRLRHRAGLIRQFLKEGGRIGWDRELATAVATSSGRGGAKMRVSVRSYRELRRVHQFGRNPRDVVWRWLNWIGGCRAFYDIGASNGLEGLYVLYRHGCPVVFVEPYTPSIESILKSLYLARNGVPGVRAAEVVHAGCGAEETYSRLMMHGAPNAGENLNTFQDASAYIHYEGNNRRQTAVLSQWVKGVTLDGMVGIHGLPEPSHVKIDVDGYEGRVMAGAEKLLSGGRVDSWAIEVNGSTNLNFIEPRMQAAGYIEAGRFEHYPGLTPSTVDIIYLRPAQLENWRNYKPLKI
jgi:FkbM family methyltransferase